MRIFACEVFVFLVMMSLGGIGYAGSVTLDGSLGHAAGPVASNNGLYTLTAANGKQVGSNLFFSLGQFNLDKNEAALFSGPNSVAIVLTRVTGGPSSIDGAIACNIPNAAFYLINPAGVVFGPDAVLYVRGSFAVTTADEVKLAGGAIFGSPGSTDATLTTASPAAFGFLSPSPAPVMLNGTQLTVQPGNAITIAAGGVTIAHGAICSASQTIAVASVASPGTVQLTGQAQNPIDVSNFSALGKITISGNSASITALNANGAAGGRIVVRGGSLTLQNAILSAQSIGSGDSAGIDIALSGDLNSTNSTIVADSGRYSASRAGDVTVSAANVNATGLNAATDNGFEQADAEGSGRGGNVSLSANSIVLSGGAFLSSATQSGRPAGTISILSPGVVTMEGSIPAGSFTIPSGILDTTSQTAPGGGAAGGVSVSAGKLNILDGASISTGTSGSGAGGDIAVTTNRLRVLDGGEIDAVTGGSGASGNITVTVNGTATLNAGQSGAATGVLAQSGQTTPGGGAGGNVSFFADDLAVLNGAEIDASTIGTGNGGSVTVTVAGDARLDARRQSDSLTGISSNSNLTTAGGGSGGDLFVTAGTLEIVDGAGMTAETAGIGAGGNIRVTVSGQATLSQGSADVRTVISSSTFSTHKNAGRAGDVTLSAGGLSILDGASIKADAVGAGSSGVVNVAVAGNAVFDGQGAAGIETGVTANSSQSFVGGDTGSVVITAGNLALSNGAVIEATTLGGGGGGNIGIQSAGGIDITGGSVLATKTQGVGGRIFLGSGGNILISDSKLNAEAAQRGNIVMTAPPAAAVVILGSTVTAEAQTVGGHVTIDPAVVVLGDNSIINGLAGLTDVKVKIDADALIVSPDSQILTDRQAFIVDTNVTAGLIALPPSLFGGGTLLAPACGAMVGGDLSSFVQTGNGGLPPEPGGWLPSLNLLPIGNGGVPPK